MKKKALVLAYEINPKQGSECAVADYWVKILQANYELDIITADWHRKDIEGENYGKASFYYVYSDHPFRQFLCRRRFFIISYRIFVKRAKRIIEKLIKENSYGLIHCLTPAGAYLYNDVFKFGIPTLIGPLGGGLDVPKGFEKLLENSKISTWLRCSYYVINRYNKHWRDYFIKSTKILIGTHYIRKILPRAVWGRTEILFDSLVDPDVFRPIGRRVSERVHVCFVGRLEPTKGPTLLLEAVRNVFRSGRDIRLTFAGSGSLAGKLSRTIQSEGLGDVVNLAGNLSRSEVIQLLNGSDIFCLPTLREPGGTSVLEAMSCGLPVITTDYGGPSYSVTADCGIKIKPTDFYTYKADLESALVYLVDNPDLRVRMGKNARQRVIDCYSPDAFRSKVYSIYNFMMQCGLS